MSHDREKGFTLIELGVVIVVLAALAVLVFTLTQRVLERGRSAVCMSNLRQIGTAIQLYANDNGDTVPYAVDWSSFSPGGASWFGAQGGAFYTRTWKDLIGVYFPPDQSVQTTGTVWACPSWQGSDRRSPPFNQYCINGWVYPLGGPSCKFNQIKEAPNTLLVADANENPIPCANRLFPIGYLPGYPTLATRHGGGSNVLYADGHVGYLSATATEARSAAFDFKPWVIP